MPALTFTAFQEVCRNDFGTDSADDSRAFSQHNGIYEFQSPNGHHVTLDPSKGQWTASFNGATGQGDDYAAAWAAVKLDEQRRYKAFLETQPAPLEDVLW